MLTHSVGDVEGATIVALPLLMAGVDGSVEPPLVAAALLRHDEEQERIAADPSLANSSAFVTAAQPKLLLDLRSLLPPCSPALRSGVRQWPPLVESEVLDRRVLAEEREERAVVPREVVEQHHALLEQRALRRGVRGRAGLVGTRGGDAVEHGLHGGGAHDGRVGAAVLRERQRRAEDARAHLPRVSRAGGRPRSMCGGVDGLGLGANGLGGVG